jgi:hypothetical protein
VDFSWTDGAGEQDLGFSGTGAAGKDAVLVGLTSTGAFYRISS